MTEQKLIAVVGATGSQGGGLVRAILADPDREFAVRALTRSARSAKAQELAAAGAQVVEADLDDAASVRAAFDGAHGAYIVTNYWAPRSPDDEARRSRAEMELAQAENAARAARDAGVAHVIWSTLEDTRDVLGDEVPTVEGRYKVPHFDAKAEADALFVRYGVPTTLLRTTFYFDNVAGGMGLARDADGAPALTLPLADQPLSGIAVEDIGKTAFGVFKRGPELIGTTVSIAGDHLTGDQYAAALTAALGEPVGYRPLGWDEYRALGFPGAVEMGNMFQYYAQNAARFTADRDLARVRELNPELQSFRDWLAAHRDDITVP
ncbi:NmrA/HSCARG family protein [Mycobacterium talmoniae]|uniref:Nucleoside-diphosphate sugar epimerase n=1 Tax=Mycobacterium talmoniae TaxID=1858794 RepID=A0A1S1NHI9_9MYCO|nr:MULTISPECIES: NmrA/HSCARG family protein [Mycobacterium]OHU98132.1 nucleoside-diphosphate sugar epimerase [Mycobacterium talmoniae]TDH48093.1 NmrA/HSCARG family protein [Mycobacterium eburneum]